MLLTMIFIYRSIVAADRNHFRRFLPLVPLVLAVIVVFVAVAVGAVVCVVWAGFFDSISANRRMAANSSLFLTDSMTNSGLSQWAIQGSLSSLQGCLANSKLARQFKQTNLFVKSLYGSDRYNSATSRAPEVCDGLHTLDRQTSR